MHPSSPPPAALVRRGRRADADRRQDPQASGPRARPRPASGPPGRPRARSARLGPEIPPRLLLQTALEHAPLAARQLGLAQTARGAKINLLGPRGSAKSTVAALALPLRAALERREPYIWIVSDSARQACAPPGKPKGRAARESPARRRLPAAAGLGRTWRHSLIVLRNGVTIEALGTGQRIRGRRSRSTALR